MKRPGNTIKTLLILRTNIKKQRKYKNAYNKLLHASTGASSVGVVSTASTCVDTVLLLTLKRYKKKLLRCYELLNKITSSLATFEVLISLSLDDGTAMDAKEFHKLQTLYLQLMTHVRNIDRKMKVETEENFRKTIMNKINNSEKALEQK